MPRRTRPSLGNCHNDWKGRSRWFGRPSWAVIVAIGVSAIAAGVAAKEPPPNLGATAPAVDWRGDHASKADSTPPPVPAIASAGGMIAITGKLDDGTLVITAIDTRRQWMAVYHIERSGQPRLVGSRPMESDFSLLLNPASPLPAEIDPDRWIDSPTGVPRGDHGKKVESTSVAD